MEWMKYQGIGVPINPVYHKAPKTVEKKQIMQDLNVPLIRWIEEWDSQKELPFYAVISDKFNELPQLKSKVRYEVKKAASKYMFVQLSSTDFFKEGYEVYRKSFDSYDTFQKPYSKSDFFKSYSTENTDKYSVLYFGIREITSKKMVAYAYGFFFTNDNYFDLKVVKFDPEHQKNNISELLFFEIGKELISNKKINFIFDGFLSMSHKSGIQEYLIRKFNYRKAYCRLRVEYSPSLKLAIKLLYFFRKAAKIIGNYSSFFNKMSILLNQEMLSRDSKHKYDFNYNSNV